MKKETETINKIQEKWKIKSQNKKRTRRYYKQAGWSRGSKQRARRKGRRKTPDRARKGKEAQKEWSGSEGAARQHEA